jgi:adenosylhomocysteine nucleosidase
MDMSRVAIVAALEREVEPMIRNWKVTTVEDGGRHYRIFADPKTATKLICGGIGPEAARRATEVVIQKVHPTRVFSVGFAGALDGSLQIADILEPRWVINASDGVRTEIVSGVGVLVTSSSVVGKEQKNRLAKAYAASAVDMEAGAVAQGARAHGLEFAAVKAISDAATFSLPPMERFITRDGSFQTARFAGYVALRPWLWKATVVLARNSSKASRALCGALANYLGRQTSQGEPLDDGLNPIERGRTEMDQIKTSPGFAAVHASVVRPLHTQPERKL